MIEFLMLIGMALGLSIAAIGGAWVGFKIVDIVTSGELGSILK